MLSNLTGWHFLIILVVVLLLFGATKLPVLARSLGQSAKIFKNEIKNDDSARTTDPETVVTTDAAKTDGDSSPKP
ncbi:twin-arginine translocase TatA/TatE family subunit [Cryobacterium tepidiphilum]|uniref:Sec-independent protein translocase protein TatA n=1 Tax=Cryobacterium tepidiphilum TaxID=2486026 RepID=A0A3M8L1F6_9MICO|nr:twin-arginine translocase TatA/TatE family subunit [Cryobacterium tepidiphilum]RNE59370.1 twin-arginine translocase TatA/TatE family subunit [Cryobacterium tepidiphilum]